MAYLQAIAYYYPEKCLTNEDISRLHPEWSADKISSKTGIYKRYLSSTDETAVDMAEKAALRLFKEFKIDKKSIDFIVLCTQSPDYYLPTSACILQDRLGLSENCGAFDYNLGCSGYVYGLGLTKGLIETGQAQNVLLITSETYTKYLHPDDKSCQTIFGDAAAASLITLEKHVGWLNAEILKSAYRTIGAQYRDLIVENGASRHPKVIDEKVELNEDGSFKYCANNLFMDGKSIFDFSSLIVPQVVEQTLVKNGISKDDVDWYIFHQANKFMLNFARMRCGAPQEKFVVDLEDGGNTVSSTIPIVMKRMMDNNRLTLGQTLLLCGFGVGLSVAGIMLKM